MSAQTCESTKNNVRLKNIYFYKLLLDMLSFLALLPAIIVDLIVKEIFYEQSSYS